MHSVKISSIRKYTALFLAITTFILCVFSCINTVYADDADVTDEEVTEYILESVTLPDGSTTTSVSNVLDCTGGDTKQALNILGFDVTKIKGLLARELFLLYGTIYLKGVAGMIPDMNISITGEHAGIWGAVSVIYDAISAVGICLMLLYFLLGLLNKMQMEHFNLEHLAKSFLQLFVALLILQNGLALLEGCLTFSNQILSRVTSAATGSTTVQSAQAALAKTYVLAKTTLGLGITAIWDITVATTMLGNIIIPLLFYLIFMLVIYTLSYSRILELFGRVAFAPIGMANILEGGLHSSGFRYFKKILAVALQGAVIVIIWWGYSQLSLLVANNTNLASTVFTFSLQELVTGCCALALLLKSQSWANDIVGV